LDGSTASARPASWRPLSVDTACGTGAGRWAAAAARDGWRATAHALEDRPAAQRRHAGTHLGRLVGAGVRNVRKPAVALKRGHRAHRGRERRHCEDGGKEQWRVVEFCRRHHRFRTTARTTARTHPPRRWPRAPARQNKPSWHRCSGRGAGATDILAGASRRTRIAEGEDSRHQAPSLRAKPRKRRNQRPHCARAAFR